MTITYDWVIDKMDCYTEKNGFNNVVFNIHWRINANEDDYSSSSYGSAKIDLDANDAFTPYDNLSKIQVIEWVINFLGQDEVDLIKKSLEEKIEKLKNPPIISLNTPWQSA